MMTVMCKGQWYRRARMCVFEAAVAHGSTPCSDPAASSNTLRPKPLATLSGTASACAQACGSLGREKRCWIGCQGERVQGKGDMSVRTGSVSSKVPGEATTDSSGAHWLSFGANGSRWS